MSPSSDAQAPVVLGAALHARPAGQVVRAAAGFTAQVEISYGDRVAAARGILGLLALGAPAGATVLVRATGPDADAAVQAISRVLTTAQ
jgi:phosphocarrier protein HPr